MRRKNINVDVILQSIGRRTKDIYFYRKYDDLMMQLYSGGEPGAPFGLASHLSAISLLSIVGSGMLSNPGVAAKMFESLYNEGVNINMISTSEIRITVLINEKDGIRAMNAVHDAFGLAD